MALELFTNVASTTVSSGGTTAPSGGTTESWTVASSASFPAAVTGTSQFHVADPAQPTEMVLVTNVSGATWSVTRGAESTTPVAHTAGFTVVQVVTAAWLNGGFSAPLQGPVVSAPVTLTDAATIAVNAALGNQFKVTLGGNRTLGAPSNPANGQIITVWFIQDGTGSRTITLASGAGGYHFGTDLTSVTLSTTASATDRMTCQYDSVNNRWDVTGFLRGW